MNPTTYESDTLVSQQDNSNLEPIRIDSESDTDISVEVKHTELSVSEKEYKTMASSDSESDLNMNIDNDMCHEQTEPDENFREKCLKELKDTEVLTHLVAKLDESKHLQDFMALIRYLANGTIPMDNIVFILMLERTRFQSCTNTIAMQYSKITKLFWSIVYRVCKGCGLKFFSGEKNWGHVVSKTSEKSKYSPEKSIINFAMPSEHVLRNIDRKLPKIIPPGKIEKCLNLLRNEKGIVLMADGKLVTKELKENFLGDVNLFGNETNPNLSDLRDDIERNLEFVSKCVVNFKISDELDKYNLIRDLTNIIMKLSGKIRKFVSSEQKRLRTYTKSVFSEQKFQKVISSCKTNIYTSAIWIKKSLQLNVKLLNLMSTMQNNNHIFSSSTQKHLSEYYNIRLLHTTDYVMSKIDPVDYPHLIKDGSEMYLDLRKQSLLTCDTVYNALGLFTSKAMKVHFRQYIQELDDPYNDASERYCGISTLINIIMPSQLPSCAVLYEEGCRFLDGKVHKKLLCSSKHWVIRHHHTTKETKWKCNHVINPYYNNIAVISRSSTEPTQHSISKNEALQSLLTMRIVKCIKCWYLGVSPNSIVLIETTFDMSFWQAMWHIIQKHYNTLKPHCPTKISEVKSKLYPIIEKYIEKNSQFIVEVPRLKDVHGQMKTATKFSTYNIPSLTLRSENSALMDNDFEMLCYDTADIIEEGYNFLCVETLEILAFVTTNCNQVMQPGIPPHLPIAYGMRGTSMSMETMREMVNDIHTELKSRNTSVLCEVYDGQFHKLNV